MKSTAITLLLLASFTIAHAAAPDAFAADSRDRPTLSINVEGQNGSSLRLLYTTGNGWKFADHSGPRLASALPQEGPTGPIPALPAETPQSVFVDGPSGYVFVYLMDEGWRFLGNVAEAKR